jgi:hypothetical protein
MNHRAEHRVLVALVAGYTVALWLGRQDVDGMLSVIGTGLGFLLGRQTSQVRRGPALNIYSVGGGAERSGRYAKRRSGPGLRSRGSEPLRRPSGRFDPRALTR